MRRLASLALILLLLPGCLLLEQRFDRKKKKTAQGPLAPLLIGTISLVSEDGTYVLIDNDSHPSPPLGTVVKCRIAGTDPVELKVTDIRKRPFVVADIVKGMPQKGDTVFQ